MRYIRARRWHFSGLFSVIMAGAACAVLVQYGMKLLVDAMASTDRASADVWTPLTLFLGLIAVENVMWRTGGWLGARTIVTTGVDMRLDLFQHLTGHPMRYFSQHFAGSLGSRITATANAAGMIMRSLTWNIVPPCTEIIGAVVVLTTIDWRMAVALACFVAIVAFAIVWFGVRGREVHHDFAHQASRAGGELVDVVSNVWTVKAFSARQRERDRLAHELGVEAASECRSWMYLEKARLLHDACLWIMAGSMLLWAVTLWRAGTITPGDVVIISALTFRILHGSRDLALAVVNTSQHLGVITDSLRVIAQPHGLEDAGDSRPLLPGGGAIEFKDVSFTYPDGRNVFDRFNLKIEAGQKVGLVGPSGSGKSTLISLIQRLDAVQSGATLIDGQRVTDVGQDSLRSRIAVVPQEIALFHRSIMENIRYGKPDATDEEVISAARHAYCDDFIRDLPDGYHTMVGERGVLLSGGQRQRLGIARAFLKDAPILILDEATSALDTQSELEIQFALEELVRGRTVLAVAHRLSTVANFDRIVVLSCGEIVEDGPPAVLRRRRGIFDRMWRLQADSLAEAMRMDAAE